MYGSSKVKRIKSSFPSGFMSGDPAKYESAGLAESRPLHVESTRVGSLIDICWSAVLLEEVEQLERKTVTQNTRKTKERMRSIVCLRNTDARSRLHARRLVLRQHMKAQ